MADFFVKGDRNEAFPRLKGKLSQMDKGYDYYLSRHSAAHKELFSSCDVQLADTFSNISVEELLFDVYKNGFKNTKHSVELTEKLWRFGRYLMICGTRDVPFPLYGLWGGGYNLMWSHNMANENLQMMYWHVLTGGLEYTMKPVISYYCDLLEDYKDNAKKIFGLDGIYVPAGSAPGMGKPNQIVPVIMNWTGAAGWLCQHFYNYYVFTKDEELLKDKILPFMEQAVLFYENFITEEADGTIKFYPSVSPENSPLNFFTKPEHHTSPHICPTAINATMDIAVFKELITNMLEISREKGLYAGKTAKWQDMLSRLPGYQTNEDGAIKEWIHPQMVDRYNHRHISHVYSVFPGVEYVKGIDEPNIIDAFKKAVDLRELGAQTGWSFAHMSSIYARFGEGEKAMECIENLSRACLLNNLFTLHNDWRRMGLSWNMGGKTAPVQMDANMGIVNAVQEMLLFASKDTIKILPALPKALSKGRARDLRFPSGKVSFEWDIAAQLFALEIVAERDATFNLILPLIKTEYRLSNGVVAKAGEVSKITVKGGEALFI